MGSRLLPTKEETIIIFCQPNPSPEEAFTKLALHTALWVYLSGQFLEQPFILPQA